MYNEELKTRFIRFYAGGLNRTSEFARRLFDHLEKFEDKWGADVCTATVEQLQPIVNNIGTNRNEYRWANVILLQEYVKWCLAEGVPGACDGALQIDRDETESVAIRQQMVASPLHLHTVLNEILEPESEETVDTIYRCYCWLIYGGMPKECVYKTKLSDVDFRGLQVRYNVSPDGGEETERFAKIYPEGLTSVRAAAELQSFLYKHPLYKPSRRDRYPGDELLRSIKSLPNKDTVEFPFNRLNAKAIREGRTTTHLSYTRLHLSGVFYRTREIECITGKIQFEDETSVSLLRDISDSGPNGKGIRAKQSQLRKNNIDDYLRWKRVFSV